MTQSKKIEFQNKERKKIVGIADFPGNASNVPIVIILQSFTGYKELKPLHAIAQECVKNGLASLRFDFSDCIGESEGVCETMTLDKQISDAVSSIDFAETIPEIDKNKIGMCGHSLGGTTAINASADPRIKAIVTIAGLAKPEWEHLFTEADEKKWKEQGWIEFDSYKKGPVKINYSFFESVMEHKCGETIKELNKPLRVIHGTKDTILDTMNAAFFFDNAKQPKDLKIIENADHMFLSSPYIEEMAVLTAGWFKKHL
jgi:dienelactone hydrolase